MLRLFLLIIDIQYWIELVIIEENSTRRLKSAFVTQDMPAQNVMLALLDTKSDTIPMEHSLASKLDQLARLILADAILWFHIDAFQMGNVRMFLTNMVISLPLFVIVLIDSLDNTVTNAEMDLLLRWDALQLPQRLALNANTDIAIKTPNNVSAMKVGLEPAARHAPMDMQELNVKRSTMEVPLILLEEVQMD